MTIVTSVIQININLSWAQLSLFDVCFFIVLKDHSHTSHMNEKGSYKLWLIFILWKLEMMLNNENSFHHSDWDIKSVYQAVHMHNMWLQ